MKFREFLFTGFYTGYSPAGPGTAGSLAAMAIYMLLCTIFGNNYVYVNVFVVLALIYPAIKLCDAGEKFFAEKDPQAVVIDEVIGYWIAVMLHPYSWKVAVVGFLLFRVMDILKPFPAGRLQNLKGGLGIMIDDVVAGIYANLALIAIRYFAPF